MNQSISTPGAVDLSGVPRLQFRIAAYHKAVWSDDESARWGAVSRLLETFQSLTRKRDVALIGPVLLTLTDLTARELTRFITWLPRNLSLYLAVCDHPSTTEHVRMNILARADSTDSFRGGEYIRRYMQLHHPLAYALYSTTHVPVLEWQPDTVEYLRVRIGSDFALQCVVAALVGTWSGSVDALLETARGIIAVA